MVEIHQVLASNHSNFLFVENEPYLTLSVPFLDTYPSKKTYHQMMMVLEVLSVIKEIHSPQ